MKSNLFTLEEREWIANNAVKIVGEGGRTFRVIDIEVARKEFCRKRFSAGLSNTLSILPIFDDSRKDRSYPFTNFYDRQFDVYYGVYIGLLPNGEPRFKRLVLQNSFDLDFTRTVDTEFWLIARMHPMIEGTPNVNNAYFKVYDETENILKNTDKVQSFLKAVDRIKKMDLKQKVYMLRFLQIPLHSTYNEGILDGLLYKTANDNPFNFNEKFASSSRSMYEIFYTATQLGIISYIPDSGYMYNGFNLGMMEFDVIATLAKEKVMLESLIDRIRRMDTMVGEIEKRTNMLKATEPNDTKQSDQRNPAKPGADSNAPVVTGADGNGIEGEDFM